MKHISKLKEAPFFILSVGNFEQGILVISYFVTKDLSKKIIFHQIKPKPKTSAIINLILVLCKA